MDGNEHLLLDRLNPLFLSSFQQNLIGGIDGFFHFDILPQWVYIMMLTNIITVGYELGYLTNHYSFGRKERWKKSVWID